MIKIENLTKHYGDVKAVKSISFDLEDTQIVGFLGANGAGKSTTLKMMTGYLTPTNGNVYVDNKNIIDHSIEDFKSVQETETLLEAVKLMGYLKVWDLPVIDSNYKLKGLLHLHPAILYLLDSSRNDSNI